MVEPTTFSVVTSENGAFATNVPASEFSQATEASASQAQTLTVFSTMATQTSLHQVQPLL
jgi:hypothetical protein